MSNYMIIGKIPPPLGGVTVFVERLADKLKQSGEKVNVVSPIEVHRAFWGMFRADHIHIHTISILYLGTFLLFRCLNKVTVFDHNHSRHFETMPKFKFLLISYLLSRVGSIKVANSILVGNYKGISKDPDVFSPFLPPVLDKRAGIVQSYPQTVLDLFDNTSPLIVTSAWKNVHESGESVYGLESFTQVAEMAYEQGLNLSFLIMLGIESEEDAQLMHKASSLPNLVVLVGQYESWPILEKAACLVRNTSTDGDSVSIREALYFNTPVLASDRAPRPEKVKLFSKDDHQQIFKLLKEII
ncbi:glycosyltransferase [Vibrio sp. T3Y01]|uniref:glycosyltransferase n=1 Tax=Vibrio sp. T3Y01 TaxID=2607606 RepID=UPI001493BF1C|nr:glycosyltransferase [Vibrio sp. T3Y01]NOI95786.1 glycosyltransferase [Vibrio sp. T3Y01]